MRPSNVWNPEDEALIVTIVELLTVALAEHEGINAGPVSIDSEGWRKMREDLYDAAAAAGVIR